MVYFKIVSEILWKFRHRMRKNMSANTAKKWCNPVPKCGGGVRKYGGFYDCSEIGWKFRRRQSNFPPIPPKKGYNPVPEWYVAQLNKYS